jgi:OFA family oxalate/formate antiporter-like MFS transporter
MSPHAVKIFILTQGIIMTVGICAAGFFLKDPPKNWWPAWEVDPLHWQQQANVDLKNNPPALRHYTVQQMWRTPQAKWIGIQYALFIGCSLFGVAYYYPFAKAMGLPAVAGVAGAAGFALTDGLARPLYGFISQYTGRRRVMIYGYAGNVVFQLLAYWAGAAHNGPLFAVFAVISGGLSGVNFPMTAALVADYYGETNNAVNYGSIYAFKALGGSFAGGVAALVMTGTLYGASHFHWLSGFVFGASLGFLAMLTMLFLVRPPNQAEMEAAVRRAPDKMAAAVV